MMMPSIFGENLFDNWMDFPFEDEFFGKKNPLYGKHEKNLMKTDVRETKDGYEVDVDLPGFKKDNISAQLQDGYLTISASKGLDKDEQEKDGTYIRKERYSGSMSRSLKISWLNVNPLIILPITAAWLFSITLSVILKFSLLVTRIFSCHVIPFYGVSS